MAKIHERAAALRHDLLHSPADWDQIIEQYSRALVEAAVQIAEESNILVDGAEYPGHEVAQAIRRELLGDT